MRSRRQRMGQHFLRDGRVAAAIAAALPAEPPRVLEIGPGRGALTAPLLERFAHVRALELDPDLAASLPARLGRPEGLEVVTGDALDVDLDEAGAGGPWLLAANLPYSVGTAILRRLLVRPELFPVIVVMVQHEVASRLLAPAGSPDRGALSVEVEARATGELLFRVPPRAFAPPPRVESAVVRLRPHPAGAEAGAVEAALRLAREAFTHRRKKLVNALSAVGDAPALVAALERAGVDPGARPQTLGLREWLALAAGLAAPGSAG